MKHRHTARSLGASLAVLFCATLFTLGAHAQTDSGAPPLRGSHEMSLWVSQSQSFHFLSAGVNGEVFQVGGRYGLLLTGSHFRGPLRGQFEYAIDAIPVIVPFQPNGATYGIGVDPFVLKWNFQPHRRIMPYMEADAGGIATLGRVPPTGSYWNFTASGAAGVQILRGRYVWSVDVRFYHISDAYIIRRDPTFNTLQLRVGFGLFHHRK